MFLNTTKFVEPTSYFVKSLLKVEMQQPFFVVTNWQGVREKLANLAQFQEDLAKQAERPGAKYGMFWFESGILTATVYARKPGRTAPVMILNHAACHTFPIGVQ